MECTNNYIEGVHDDLEIVVTEPSAEDRFFDSVIGHIEDILMEEAFQHLQKCFMERHWHHFEDGEENKLCYMDIFKEYTDVVEKYIETQLANKISDFSMDRFIQQLQKWIEEVEAKCFTTDGAVVMYKLCTSNTEVSCCKKYRFVQHCKTMKHKRAKAAGNKSAQVQEFLKSSFSRQTEQQPASSKTTRTRKNELDGEVFDMLFTFSDFIAFKEMFLDYKAVKTGTVADLSKGICVTSGVML